MGTRFEHGYALLLGVGRTAHAPWSLPVTVHDVKAIKDILTDPLHCAYPDSQDHIQLLHDEAATKPAILDGLSWLKDRAENDPEATALVYYAGHGFLEQSTGLYYLIPHEADHSDISGSAIPATVFTQAIQSIPARRLLIVLDCCHAEGMATASRDLVPLEPPTGFATTATPDNLLAALKQGEGRAVFSASRGSQRAWDRADRTQGIYTYHFIEALKGAGTLPGLTEVQLSHLMSHVSVAVPMTAKQQWGTDQTPYFDIKGVNFPVALTGGKAIRSVPLAPADVEPVNVFDGDYKYLKEAYISPWPVFERVKIDRFTGRAWLEERLDAFLQNPQNDRGVFVLEAEAGLGKTAFLAHLAQSRRYIHHFSELARGQDGIAVGLRNLAAQLIRIWELNPYLIDGMLPGSAGRSDFLQNLLKEAADRRDQIQPGEPIVLVVDALDEAGTPAGQNVLGLPRVLPKGVFLVVSQRPVEVTLFVDGPRLVEPLRADDTKNRGDMRTYLESAVTWLGVRKALESSQRRIPDSLFIETLLEKSRGVWIYLHYVVAEIERGQRLPLKLDELPRDLWQYYADYWKRWRDAHSQTWDALDLPLLTTLAAAQEGLPLDALLSLAGIDPSPENSRRARRVLDGEWSPYLATPAAPRAARAYRFYHASLREFFSGAIESGNLTRAEQFFAEELAETTQQTHARICDLLTIRWGGWDTSLPALRTIEPARLDPLDQYGLHHLTAHLEAAGREDDLDRLLRLEWATETGPSGQARHENAWFTVHDRTDDLDGYMSDVARAWRLADRAMESEPSARLLSRQLRAALISASIGSLVANIPAQLLVELVKAKLWPAARALAFARRMSDPERCARTLTALAPHLEKRLLAEALSAARAIEDEEGRARALGALAPHLGPDLLAEALSAARSIKDASFRFQALSGLLLRLEEPGQVLAETLDAARSIRDERDRVRALNSLTPRFGADLFSETLSAARSIGDHWTRARELSELAMQVEGEPRLSGLAEALSAARLIENAKLQAEKLGSLAVRMEEPERARALAEALSAARLIADAKDRAETLSRLAMQTGEPERARALAEALSAARLIVDEKARVRRIRAHLSGVNAISWDIVQKEHDQRYLAQVLGDLAIQMEEPAGAQILAEALAMIREMSKPSRVDELCRLAMRMEEPERSRLLTECLEVARSIETASNRFESLNKLAVAFEGEVRSSILAEALAAATAIKTDSTRAQALSSLAPQLEGPERARVLTEALAATRAIDDEGTRAWVLTDLVPELGVVGRAKVLDAARAIVGEWPRAHLLNALTVRMEEPTRSWTLDEALTAARSIAHAHGRADELVRLAEGLEEPERARVLAEALDAAREIWWDRKARAQALSYVASRLEGSEQAQVLAEALDVASSIETDDARASQLAKLASLCNTVLRAEVVKMAEFMRDGEPKVWLMSTLAPRLEGPERSRVLAETLAVARAIGKEEDRARALSHLAPLLEKPERSQVLAEALDATQAIGDARARAWMLRDLAPLLEEVDRPHILAAALAAAQTIKSQEDRAKIFSGLAQYLDPAVLVETWAAAHQILGELDCREALSDLVPHMTSLPKSSLIQLWSETLHTLPVRRRSNLLEDLKALLPITLPLGGAKSAEALALAIVDVGRWWP